ncbi:hypothetical protein [Spiroplasma ixodetis]|uniref:hypothetical protein n=1 Tax=Spiroplasma ixodetis TaxID=2141 RepID=UPI0025784602|nr:hypothetical protein [Spiroplasma ixodetis]
MNSFNFIVSSTSTCGEKSVKNLIFQEINLLNQFKSYAISINEPLTENNIDNLYIINNYSQPYQNPKTRSTKSITIIKIKDFKTRDGYPIIIKLQKPLDKDIKVIGLKIKSPRSMIFGNIKVLGEVDNMERRYTQSYLLNIRYHFRCYQCLLKLNQKLGFYNNDLTNKSYHEI